MPSMEGGKEPASQKGFFFLGNLLVLDFLNTRPTLNNGPIELLPDFAALLRWFHDAGEIDSAAVTRLRRWEKSAAARRTLQAMLSFRERMRKEVTGWEKGARVGRKTLKELNQLLARYPMRNRLRSGENGDLGMQLYSEFQEPEDLFAPLAHSAALLFSTIDPKRVRKCDRCVLHFHDVSKKGTRRWCSMQFCGNRLKVAAYAARKRSAASRQRRPMAPEGRRHVSAPFQN